MDRMKSPNANSTQGIQEEIHRQGVIAMLNDNILSSRLVNLFFDWLRQSDEALFNKLVDKYAMATVVAARGADV